MGTMVSGSAVPTAANTLPTAPAERSSFAPSHSTALVNSSQPKRMMTRAPAARANSMEDDDESTGGEGEFDDQPIRPPNL